MTPDETFEKFKEDVWKTSSARFNAYRRLRNKNAASIFCISFLSLFNISMFIFEWSDALDVNNVSLIFSVFIIIVSLLEFAKDYSVKAERLHVNAMVLTDFEKSLGLLEGLSEEAHANYSTIKRSCPENHEPYDVELFKLGHKVKYYKDENAFIFFARSIFVRFKYFISTYGIYVLFICSSIAITFYPYIN